MAEWSGSRERKKSARVERVSGANLPRPMQELQELQLAMARLECMCSGT